MLSSHSHSEDTTPSSGQGLTPTRGCAYGAIGTGTPSGSRNTANSSLTTVTPTHGSCSGPLPETLSTSSPFRNARFGVSRVLRDNYNDPFPPANGPSMAFQPPVYNPVIGSGRPLGQQSNGLSSFSAMPSVSLDPFVEPAANDHQRRVMNMLQNHGHFDSGDIHGNMRFRDPAERLTPGSLGMLENSFDSMHIAAQPSAYGNSVNDTGGGFPVTPYTPPHGLQVRNGVSLPRPRIANPRQASKVSPSRNLRRSSEKPECRIMIQVGAAGQDHDNHASTFMDPVIQLEALHIATHYAKLFGNIVQARMLALPIRPGRTVVTIEVAYLSEKLAHRAVEANRERSVHGTTSFETRAFLPGGVTPSTTYCIWACEYDEIIFDERRFPLHGSSSEEDAAANYSLAMQRRWLGNYNGLAIKQTPSSVIEEQAERVTQLHAFHKKALTLPTDNMRRRRHFRASSRSSTELSDDEIYYLHVLDILAGRDIRSSVMIKNLPVTVNAMDLKSFLDFACEGLFDFSYLRMDFAAGTNIGYAFVNFTDSAHIVTLAFALMFKRFAGADRASDLSYAAFQGRDTLIGRFRNSAVMGLPWLYRPHLWFTYGNPNCGGEERFPACNNHMKYRNSQKNIANEGLYNAGNNRSPSHRHYGRKWSSPPSHKKSGRQSSRARGAYANGNFGYANYANGNYSGGSYDGGSYGAVDSGMGFMADGDYYSSPTRKGRGC